MKNFKRVLVIIVSLCMVFSVCQTSQFVDAKKAKKSAKAKSGSKSKKKNKSNKKNKKSGKSNKSGKSKKQNASSPKLSDKNITMIIGDKYTLVVKNAKKVSWSSSDNKVVTVSKGVVKAKKAGSATITAKASGKELTCKVTVYGIDISGFSIKVEDDEDLQKDGSLKLYLDSDDDDDDDDDEIDEDDSEDEVDEDDEDDEDDDDGDYDDDDEDSYKLDVSFTAKLKGKKISVAKAIKMSSGLVWSSSNKKVVTVDKNGNVRTVAKGTATIKVTLGKKTAKIKVVVADATELDSNSDDEEDDEDTEE